MILSIKQYKVSTQTDSCEYFINLIWNFIMLHFKKWYNII